ncbi:MAG: cyanophycin synthetase [Candidatus Krumholzibacteria bacterium]|jgi:dihydrofolate synthase/folylpolyglutamate synthase|nr:cyanophycin synthetase [Candidatus Krumholzibacteria bacterium]
MSLQPGVGLPAGSYAGEPGIGVDLAPPFVAEDEATRWLFSLNRLGIRPGLVRVQALLDALGNPERTLRTLVVAGTNGKGSTTRILAHLLQKTGLKVAAFTSPHLLRVYERLTIGGEAVAPDRFAAQISDIRPLAERLEASWFETLTAVALQICRDERADVLCAETGLGGRLDATNALPAVATLLTTVDLDHQHILGATREEILAEKLGLLKRDTPFFCAVDDALKNQAFAAAVQAGSPPYFLDELARWHDTEDGWRLVVRERVIEGLPRLAAPILQRNAALALLCLEELARRGVLSGPDDPAAALADLFLPGRFQLIWRQPDWIVDTAHNTQALRVALETFLARPVAGPRVVLFGGMQDKTVAAEIGPLLRRCDAVTMVPVALPRSRTRADLAALRQFLELPDAGEHSTMDTVPAALAYWRRNLQPDAAVLATGSCFLVAEVLHHLGFRDLEETRPAQPAAGAQRGETGG